MPRSNSTSSTTYARVRKWDGTSFLVPSAVPDPTLSQLREQLYRSAQAAMSGKVLQASMVTGFRTNRNLSAGSNLHRSSIRFATAVDQQPRAFVGNPPLWGHWQRYPKIGARILLGSRKGSGTLECYVTDEGYTRILVMTGTCGCE